MTQKIPALVLAIALLALASACGGGDDDDAEEADPGQATPAPPIAAEGTETAGGGGAPVSVVIASSGLITGENRFTFGLLDAENQTVDGLSGSLTLFNDPQGAPEALATYDFQFLPLEFPDPENPPDIGGIYTATVDFPGSGLYGAQITPAGSAEVTQGLRILIEVQEEAAGVQVGDQAPSSDTPTTVTTDNIETIDSDDPPNPQLHELSIAEAVQSGRPTVVSFATPAFCTSRLCGPMVDVILNVHDEYQDRVNFIQVEPFQLGDDGQPVLNNGAFVDGTTFAEWGLVAEPVTFIIGADGVVAYRFESITTQDELRAALDAILA
ncbi:MAG: hypothetical protein GEU28_00840 [Dehalococcoidia bacterium]|nr:hypothetical protein [Dehalococcoidia bacterium]